MTLIDISPPLRSRIGVWPGDTPLSRETLLDTAAGDNITLSALRSTVHVGAHTDSWSHVVDGAATIDAMPLEAYVGPCLVVDVEVDRGARIGASAAADVLAAATAPRQRVLFRTSTFPDPDAFSTDFAALSSELIHRLAGAGVRLVGIDTPSVDLFDSKDLPAHRACVERGVAILEGVVLGHVEPGPYELIALPLALEGFDASPVRAVLRSS